MFEMIHGEENVTNEETKLVSNHCSSFKTLSA